MAGAAKVREPRRLLSILKIPALLLPAVMILLSGCELVLEPTVPPYMVYVTEELDLSTVLPSRLREVRLEMVPAGPEGSPLFVLLARPDSAGPDLVVMVEGALRPVRVRQASTDVTRFDTPSFRRLDGFVQVGNLVYNTEGRTLTNGPRLGGDDRPLIPSVADARYYLVSPEDQSSMRFDRYDDGFLAAGGAVTVPYGTVIPEATDPIHHVDARMYDDRTADFTLFGDDFLWFFSLEVGSQPPGSASAENTVLISPWFETGRVERTSAGLITRRHGNELVRINRETGRVLDTFELDPDLDVAFDPAGQFYLLFDPARRILYKVAPWW